MNLYRFFIICTFGFVFFFTLPLVAMEEENPEASLQVKIPKRKREENEPWVSYVQEIISDLNNKYVTPEQAILNAKEKMKKLNSEGRLPGSDITGDNAYWLKISFQDLSGSNHEKSIQVVTTKLTSLIEEYGNRKRSKAETHPVPKNESTSISERKEKLLTIKDSTAEHSNLSFGQENLEKKEAYQKYLMMVEEEGGEQKVFEELKALYSSKKLDDGLYPLLHALKSNQAESIKQAKGALLDKIKTIDESNKPYALIPPTQPEERWRWRQNFKLKVYSLNGSSHKIFDCSNLHLKLSQTLNMAQNIIGLEEDANIIVPAISIIYETDDGEILQTTSMMKWLGRDDNCCIFISGLKTFDTPYHTIRDNNYMFITGGDLNITPHSLKNMAQKFYYQTFDEKLSQFREFIYGVTQLSEHELRTTLGTYFNHSEQWLINYLSNSYEEKYGFSQYGNLCSIIDNVLVKIHNIRKINKIIFHLRSKNDICDVCSPTISLFLEKLNRNLDHIGGLLTQHTRFRNLFDPGTKFFILTSSHKLELGQASYRKHYHNTGNHGQRREYFGRDRNSNDAEEPIEMKEDIPYSYIQVPVNEAGKPVNLG